jgi:hypothetical protein
MACADEANARAKAIAVNLIIIGPPLFLKPTAGFADNIAAVAAGR